MLHLIPVYTDQKKIEGFALCTCTLTTGQFRFFFLSPPFVSGYALVKFMLLIIQVRHKGHGS